MSGILDSEIARQNHMEQLTKQLDTSPSMVLAQARQEATAAKKVAAEATGTMAVVRCLQDVFAVPVSWLWAQRIARGKVTLIAGDPGLGKSQLTASIAACVSVGGRWPVDQSNAPRGNILILNAEDDPADTIRPRVDAAQADVSRIFILDAVYAPNANSGVAQRSFDLTRDIETLRKEASRIGDVMLIIIDPISAYLGGTNSHCNADVRTILAPLTALAADIGAAVLLVSHLNKSAGSDAMMRVSGSLAFVAAARAAYLVVRDAQDPARRLFLPAKNNLGPDQGAGLAFRIVPVTLANEISTSRIDWESEPVAITANEALAAAFDDPEKRSARAEAELFLRELLSDGPMPAKDVQRAAQEAGHSKATIRRAKEALAIIVDKEGYQGPWCWSLPSKVLKLPKDAHEKSMNTFGADERLCPNDANAEVI